MKEILRAGRRIMSILCVYFTRKAVSPVGFLPYSHRNVPISHHVFKVREIDFASTLAAAPNIVKPRHHIHDVLLLPLFWWRFSLLFCLCSKEAFCPLVVINCWCKKNELTSFVGCSTGGLQGWLFTIRHYAKPREKITRNLSNLVCLMISRPVQARRFLSPGSDWGVKFQLKM